MKLLLIGQPNVGKSSIFNILINKNINIIHHKEGTTRDWHYSSLKNFPEIKIYDSPGFKIEKNNLNVNKFFSLFSKIDVFLYVIDYKNYQNLYDSNAINDLRKYNKDIVLIINKDDKMEKINYFTDFGIKKIFFLSCSHRLGFDELNHFIKKYSEKELKEIPVDFSISIYGKPNAGKSTLLNKILGYNRSATSEIAGTTSDIVYDTFNFKNKNFKIFDTAGIGKKSKTVKGSINFLSIKKSIDNIKKADLNLLIIDSTEGFDRQTKRIYSLLINSSSLIVIFNKIDLIKDKKIFYSDIKYQFENELSKAKNFTLLFICSLKNKDVYKLKNSIYSRTSNILFKLSTNEVNSWLKKIISDHPHPLIKGKKVNFKYATQIKSRPITVKIFCNFASKIKKNYQTFLLNDFSKKFKIKDKKVKLIFSSSINPYANS